MMALGLDDTYKLSGYTTGYLLNTESPEHDLYLCLFYVILPKELSIPESKTPRLP